jgi:hypothetical protein
VKEESLEVQLEDGQRAVAVPDLRDLRQHLPAAGGGGTRASEIDASNQGLLEWGRREGVDEQPYRTVPKSPVEDDEPTLEVLRGSSGLTSCAAALPDPTIALRHARLAALLSREAMYR